MNSHLWWVHATLFPTTCWAMIMCELTLAVSHPPHRRRIGGSRGVTYRGVRFDLGGVSELTFWRQGWILDPVIFIFYFVRLSLCNKYSDYIVTFISINSVIIYVIFFGACMRCTRLCPLKPGCDKAIPSSESRPLNKVRLMPWREDTFVTIKQVIMFRYFGKGGPEPGWRNGFMSKMIWLKGKTLR
jgi:hypothetical protein